MRVAGERPARGPHGPGSAHRVFLVTRWEGEVRGCGDEHDQLRWFGLEETCAVQPLASDRDPALFRLAASAATGMTGFEVPGAVRGGGSRGSRIRSAMRGGA